MKIPVLVTFEIEEKDYPNYVECLPDWLACALGNDPENNFMKVGSITTYRFKKGSTLNAINKLLDLAKSKLPIIKW